MTAVSLWRPKQSRRPPADPGDSIRDHYRRRLERYKRNWAVCHWAGADSQKLRFSVLTSNVDLRGKRLLDVGCGLGDLWTFLGGDDSDLDYTGVDLVEQMVTEGKRRNPGANLICADLFGETGRDMFAPQSFDVVFCSGALNLELGNNETFVPRALANMFELTRDVLAFNLLHKRATPAGGAFHPFYPGKVLEMLRDLPCRTTVIDDYLPNDFTVICKRL